MTSGIRLECVLWCREFLHMVTLRASVSVMLIRSRRYRQPEKKGSHYTKFPFRSSLGLSALGAEYYPLSDL